MNVPKRKLQRLKKYDYSQNGAYFITICTRNRVQLFGRIQEKNLVLNNAGKMVGDKFGELSEFYDNISIDRFVVMPNHLHAIVMIDRDGTAQGPFPTMSLPDYVHRYKTLTTILYIDGVKSGDDLPFDKKVWQKSYHDHIIRNEAAYLELCEYIETNPLKWELDKYYCETL